MELHELLEEAIRGRKVIGFRYDSKEGAYGPRVGSPHALYAHPKTRNVSCDIHQHRGDSATDNVVPFKPFLLAKMSDVQIVDDEDFRLWHLYDGDAPRYVNAIAKLAL
jgi:hypothetical protein